MKNKSFIVILVVLVVVIAAAGILYKSLGKNIKPEDFEEEMGQSTQEVPEENLTEAPSFTMTDADGNELTLDDFKGKPIILNFWASWCGPCRSEMPEFDAAFAEYGEEIHFVLVNMTDGKRETVEGASRFMKDQGFTMPTYFDTQQDAAATYGVRALPTTYFIDADGYLMAQAKGAIDGDLLKQGIDLIMEKAE